MLHIVMDVESVGIHGKAFAVGYVAVDDDTFTVVESKLYACSADIAHGTRDSHLWVVDNVPHIERTHASTFEVKEAFWKDWQEYSKQSAVLWAHFGWPVEARFLSECVEQDHNFREWLGPYPLHEIASLQIAAGLDPYETVPRLKDEEPEHNPLNDARHSARILSVCMKIIRAKQVRLKPTRDEAAIRKALIDLEQTLGVTR